MVVDEEVAGVGAESGTPTDADPPRPAVVEVVSRALAEDLLPMGDLTAGLVPPGTRRVVAVVSRSAGIVAGRACAEEVFAQVDPTIGVDWRLADGSPVSAGSVVAVIDGPLRSILTAERSVLNLLCHLSGVATLTRRFVDAVAAVNPAVRVLDTRQPLPGLRALQKA
ncbi:MAG: nicotinate-nucleotide diphosphorylase (carboxylating), partial [Actinomycetota bacterium]|nr:nicotinate-nucleotide diphosphorylase (carboxylating) [Actinomycetota bacterium]